MADEQADGAPDDGGAAIAVVEERAVLAKRSVATGRVRLRLETRHEQSTASGELEGEAVEIERVAVGAEIDRVPEVRTEICTEGGEVTVVPVVEEVLVVEKRLVLKEEVRIRRRPTREPVEVPVTLRRQEAHVERVASGAESGPDPRPERD